MGSGTNNGTKKPTPEEVAKLWMNENSVVNTKVAYFTAVNAALGAALTQTKNDLPPVLVAIAGLLVALAAFFSIARTCAYRRHFRQLLDQDPDYKRLFVVEFAFYEKLKSNKLLTLVPFAAIAGWLLVLVLAINYGAPHRW